MAITAKKTTQQFTPIKDIRDGVIVLKNGSTRKVLMVSSINFALKSQEEQTAILLQFQNFLNSLDFSVQMFVQSKKLDIEPYLEILKNRMEIETNDLIKIQTREYIDFIKNFTGSINIMSKTFFVIIPYTSSILSEKTGVLGKFMKGGKKEEGAKKEDVSFQEVKVQLEQRAIIVEQGLRATGVRTARLGSEELIELFYKTFNPGEGGKPAVPEEDRT